jgi:tetratricopeptide (TPR) repeat protein
MWGRLQARGLAIGLAIVILILLSPSPIPRRALQAWTTATRAALSGDTASATAALQTFQDAFPWLSPLRDPAIRLALANQDGARALTLLDAGIPEETDEATARCWRAEALALEGEWAEAAGLLPLPNGEPCPAPIRLMRLAARQALDAQDLDAALVHLRRLIMLDPSDIESATLLGAGLVLVDPAAAPAVLEAAERQGNVFAAELATALRSAPASGRPGALAGVGRVFLQRSAWPLAAGAFRELIVLEPGNAEAHAYYGLALQQMGLEGLPALEEALRLDPGSAPARSMLGLHWLEQGQPQQAVLHLRRALDLDPQNSAFAASLAAAEAAAGDVQAALADFRQAAELDPANPVFWRLLADFCLAREIEIADTAIPAARNAVALSPNEPDSIDLLGYAHFLTGNRTLAERLLARAVLLDPASAAPRLHYGMLLSAQARNLEARSQLAAAASLGADTPTGELARRALLLVGE